MYYSNVPKSSNESYYALRASRALERAFIPITTEALASFVFAPTPRIPSKAFASSLVLHVTHKLTHSGLSDPRRAFLSPTLVHEPRLELTTVHLVLTPLKFISGAVVGVVSAKGITLDGSVVPFADALNDGIKRGRFVYDIQKKAMVSVVDDLGPGALGVVTTKWVDDKHHERLFFAIPKEQYSFDYMPKKALVVLTNFEYQVSKVHKDNTWERTSETPDKLFEALSCGLPTNNSVQKLDTFDFSGMAEAIEHIARSMSGVYFGPNLKRDVINPATGELSSRASGKMVCRLKIPDYMGQCRVRRMIAQDYFLKLLPPGSERWFMQNEYNSSLGFLSEDIPDGTSEGAWDDDNRKGAFDPGALTGLGSSEGMFPVGDAIPYSAPLFEPDRSGTTNTSSSGVPSLLGDMIPPYKGPGISTSTPLVSGVPTQFMRTEMGEEDLRKQKDEERRIRNRLSAAKSNEKRKKREREQKIELETLRQRIPILESVRERLLAENHMLRKLAEGVL